MISPSSLISWFLVPLLLASVEAAPFPDASRANVIQGHYIFLMKQNLSAKSWQAHLDWSSALPGQKKWIYNSGQFKGYCGNFSQEAVKRITASDDVSAQTILFPASAPDHRAVQVEFVEPDTYVKTSAFIAQANATWGLSRISQRQVQSNVYTFDESAGAGTVAYVIDSGINTAHLEFEGRASFGANFAQDGVDDDLAGHGTHVAGTIGSRAFGVAKRTQLVAVKVLNKDGVGGVGDVLAGLNWAVQDAKAKGALRSSFANLSLDGPASRLTNTAVARAIGAGLFVGVAAGNDGVQVVSTSRWTKAHLVQKSASLFSPASAEAACTVGASNQDDSIASFSNFGSSGG